MPRLLARAALFLSGTVAVLAQPVVAAVENNYSYISPGLPNYGIAQGSIFVIFGSNFAASSSGLQALPLTTTVNGASVQFTVQGTTTNALLYYVMPDQIAGIVPSATPFGAGTVTVTSNGQASAPASVTVVQSAVGIAAGTPLFDNSKTAFDSNWKPVGPSNAANPGDIVTFFGTGAGPVPGDESILQTPQNLSNIPLEIDIGGIPATIDYHGRSLSPGLDQFNVVIPSGATGCNVSVVARSGNIVSNFVFISIAANSRICSDQIPGVSLGPSATLTGKSSYNTGFVNLTDNVVSAPAMTISGHVFPAHTINNVNAGGQFMQQQLNTPFSTELGSSGLAPSFGSCTVGSYTLPLPNQGPAPVSAAQAAAAAGSPTPSGSQTTLNAGPALNFTGPNGKSSISFQAFQSGVYAGTLTVAGSNPPPFIPSSGATLTIDNGTGGPDIGAFTTQVSVPPPLVWTNMNDLTTVDRSQPLTITWSGGSPTGYVGILGSSTITTTTDVVAVQFNCSVPVAAQQFTVPSSVLLALPPQPLPVSGGFAPTLQLSNQTNFLFSAPNLDGGIIYGASISNLTVPYQ